MSAEQLIHSFGYLALLIGALMEGETILVLAGFAAHLGYLKLPKVILIASLATTLCDQFVYFMGSIYGQRFLEWWPAFKARTTRFRTLLKRYQNLAVVGFRFMYGMRIVAPFVIGMSGIAVPRFVILNIISAFIWATVFSVGGFFFGAALQLIIGDIRKYETRFMIILGTAGLLIWLALMYRDKRRRENNG